MGIFKGANLFTKFKNSFQVDQSDFFADLDKNYLLESYYIGHWIENIKSGYGEMQWFKECDTE